MSFRSYAVKRILFTIFTFFAIATIIFFLFRMVGSPLSLFIGGNLQAGQVQEIKETFGLDEPLYVQYYKYLLQTLQLEWGISYRYLTPVEDVVIERLLNSLLITLPSILIAYVGGILGGAWLGWKRGTPAERIGMVTALVFRSTPRFWLGLLLIFVFGVWLAWLPMSGIMPPGTDISSHLALLTQVEFYHHAILPILSMTLYLMGLPLLLMRTTILETTREDFINVVRAKGATERSVLYKHAARNAMVPTTTAFGVAVGYSFGGNVLVETVFSYPGIGRLMVNSVFVADFPVAQFSFLTMAAAILFMNLLVDLTYGFIDPRVSYD